jgi:integral membrane protein
MFKDLLITHLGRLRITALVEGWSFLILLFIAMPLKYFAGIPEVVRVVGMAHGVLFILYVLFVFIVTIEKKWSLKVLFLLFLASLVPFATFYADKTFLKKQA